MEEDVIAFARFTLCSCNILFSSSHVYLFEKKTNAHNAHIFTANSNNINNKSARDAKHALSPLRFPSSSPIVAAAASFFFLCSLFLSL